MKKILSILMIIMVGLLYGCKEDCGVGYTGDDCNTEIRSQYYGSYNTVTNCSTAYTITIASSAKGVTFVEIGNIDKLGSTVFAEFEPSNQTTLVIPQQTVNGNIFQGSFSYTSGYNSANVSYTKNVSGSLSNCTGTSTK